MMKNLVFSCMLFLTAPMLFAQNVFTKDGKLGLKANDSTLLLEPKYEKIFLCYSLEEANNSFNPKSNDWGDDFSDDFGGDEIDEDLDAFSDMEKRTPPKYVTVQIDNKRGLLKLNKNGNGLEKILPNEFQSFQGVYKGLGGDFEEGETLLFLLQKENKWGIFSPEESKIGKIDYKFDSLSIGKNSANWILAKKEDKWGFLHKENLEVKSNFAYSQKPDFRFENTYCTKTLPNKDYRCVILIPEDKSVRTIEYFNLSKSKYGGLIGRKNGLWGVVHTSGLVLLPFEYDKIEFTRKYNSFKLTKNEKTGLAVYSGSEMTIESEGAEEDLMLSDTYHPIEIKMPVEFDEIRKQERVFYATKDKKVGLYSSKGEEILPVEFDKINKTYRKQKLTATKDGKQGIITYSESKGKFQTEIELPLEYEKLQSSYYLKGGYFAKKDGKYGIMNADYSVELPFEYDSLIHYPQYFLKKNGKWGRIQKVKNTDKLEFETTIPFENPGFRRLENSSHFALENSEGKLKIYSSKTNAPISRDTFDKVGWEKNGVVWFLKGGKYGLLDLETGEISNYLAIEALFKPKWEAPIGQTTYRTNIMFANGQIVVGSNGSNRNQADSKDGIYLIDPKTGKVNQQITPALKGKTDVNGQAISGNWIFFANENGEAFCYDFSGKQIWKSVIRDSFKGDYYYDTGSKIGEIENSPALADMNGDGKEDAVFTSEAGQIYILNGENGERIALPKFERKEQYSFLATPTLYDISGDGTPDILTGGRWNNLIAIDGKTGELIWKKKHFSTISSSNILLREDESPKLLVASRSNRVDIADLKTGETEKRIFHDSYDAFASPMLTPNKTFVVSTSAPRSEGIFQTFSMKPESWETDSKDKILYLPKANAISTHKSNRISSTGFVADVLGNGAYQIGLISESGEFSLIDDEGKIIKQYRLPAGAEAPIFVGDIDSDGKLEIVFACLDGMLRCYDTNSEGKVFWGQFRGDNKNSGIVDFR